MSVLASSLAGHATQLGLLVLALVAVAPLAWSLRRRSSARGRRDAALALHRAQLAELDRDLADGRIAPAEHAAAMLEVQRRLLAAADSAEPAPSGTDRVAALGVLAVAVIPLAALGLYMVAGRPELPSAPRGERLAQLAQEQTQSQALVDALRARLATLDPNSELARQGYVLLGNAQDGLGHLAAAAEAWRQAVRIRFDPTLAAAAAEAQTRIDGTVSSQSQDLFRRALAQAPADAPWRPVAEKRLTEAAGG